MKSKGTVPPMGALRGIGRDRTCATDTRRRPNLPNRSLRQFCDILGSPWRRSPLSSRSIVSAFTSRVYGRDCSPYSSYTDRARWVENVHQLSFHYRNHPWRRRLFAGRPTAARRAFIAGFFHGGRIRNYRASPDRAAHRYDGLVALFLIGMSPSDRLSLFPVTRFSCDFNPGRAKI